MSSREKVPKMKHRTSHLARYTLQISLYGEDQFVLNFAFQETNKFPAIDSLPKFYQEVINAYAQHKFKDEPAKANEILLKPLWEKSTYTP